VDLHHLLLAGLPAHLLKNPKGTRSIFLPNCIAIANSPCESPEDQSEGSWWRALRSRVSPSV
jgi:hypothetical protein